jgi:RNA polymerase sigma-70 factor (ECF subfamily)
MDTTIEGFEELFRERFLGCDPQALTTADDLQATAAAAGDDGAFRILIERYQDRVFHFCYQWLRNTEDAKEACQDTFVRAYLSIGLYERRGKFASWIYRIALHQCHDRHKSKASRQRRRTSSLDDSSVDFVCSGPRPDESVAGGEDLEKLRRKIDLLPAKFREVVMLSCLEDLSHEVCAEILGISARAVEGRLYRARTLLSEWLGAEK